MMLIWVRRKEKMCMGPFLGMMPRNVLKDEIWCSAGHHALEQAAPCLQPPRVTGHDAQQRAVRRNLVHIMSRNKLHSASNPGIGIFYNQKTPFTTRRRLLQLDDFYNQIRNLHPLEFGAFFEGGKPFAHTLPR